MYPFTVPKSLLIFTLANRISLILAQEQNLIEKRTINWMKNKGLIS